MTSFVIPVSWVIEVSRRRTPPCSSLIPHNELAKISHWYKTMSRRNRGQQICGGDVKIVNGRNWRIDGKGFQERCRRVNRDGEGIVLLQHSTEKGNVASPFSV